MRKKDKKRHRPLIAVIGGGTGVFTVLSGLREYPVDLAAIVTMADGGGSSGVLREEFGILPPGDVRKALVALSGSDNKILAELFNYRFQEGNGLKGHAFGNLMLTALERISGSFERAIEQASRILAVGGRVIPVTLENVELTAELVDGSLVRGEHEIDSSRSWRRTPIKRVFLTPEPDANPRAEAAIKRADLIVVGPGDLYTSIMPNLVVPGIAAAIRNARAKKVYVINVMTKRGETDGFNAADFIRVAESVLGKDFFDYAIFNTRRPRRDRIRHYEKEGSEVVEKGDVSGRVRIIEADFLRRQGFIRHDSARLAAALFSLL
jgi:uncharacterized cofD-like protein